MKRKTIEDVLDAFPDGWPEKYNYDRWIGIGVGSFGDILPYMSNTNIADETWGCYKICTREEFETAHKARKEKETSKWIPEVGEECECTYGDKVEWVKCYLTKDENVLVHTGGSGWIKFALSHFDGESSFEFRQIKSARDEWVDKARAGWLDGANKYTDAFEYIYDAIASGKLEVPEVEKC